MQQKGYIEQKRQVLIGTTNASKVRRFEELMQGFDLEFLTLRDLHIEDEPVEEGATPVENAVIKARFYGQFFDTVICNDSGLYLEELPITDARQPGLHVRTPGEGKRLDDEEMIAYYSQLIRSPGGKCRAYYTDGIAVYNRGEVYSFVEDDAVSRQSYFYMVEKPSDKRHEGWPLDSISLNRNTLTYFVEEGNNKYDTTEESIILGEYRQRVVAFLRSAIGLK